MTGRECTLEELAREAGLLEEDARTSGALDLFVRIGRFAALVRAQALEEAAGICEKQVAVYVGKMNATEVGGERWDRFDNYRDSVDFVLGEIRAAQGAAPFKAS